MPILQGIRTDTISAAGSLIQYPYKEAIEKYVLDGGAGDNLVAGISVKQNPADPVWVGMTYKIKYKANVVYTGGNIVTIFGRALTATEATKVLDIEAICVDIVNDPLGTWEVKITPDLDDSGIGKDDLNADVFADAADIDTGTSVDTATTPKAISDWFANILATIGLVWGQIQTFTLGVVLGNISPAKFVYTDGAAQLQGTDILEVITKEVSFETGELGGNEIVLPYKATLTSVNVSVVSALIEATDDATIDVANSISGFVTGLNPITIPAGSLLDTIVTGVATANNSMAAGSSINLLAGKVTPGGRVFVTVNLTRDLS